MAVTIPIQTRLSYDLTKALDSRAADAGVTRAELVRQMLETALASPSAATTDPLLLLIANEVGALAAKVDASLAASRGAHAATRLAGLMLLPTDRQAAYMDKLAAAVRS